MNDLGETLVMTDEARHETWMIGVLQGGILGMTELLLEETSEMTEVLQGGILEMTEGQGEILIVMTEGHDETSDEMIEVLVEILVMIEVRGVILIMMIVVQGETLVEIETLIEVHAEIWIEMIGALVVMMMDHLLGEEVEIPLEEIKEKAHGEEVESDHPQQKDVTCMMSHGVMIPEEMNPKKKNLAEKKHHHQTTQVKMMAGQLYESKYIQRILFSNYQHNLLHLYIY